MIFMYQTPREFISNMCLVRYTGGGGFLENLRKVHQKSIRIQQALRLHNFILNYRGENEDQCENEEELNQASDYFMRNNPLTFLGTTSEGSGCEGRRRRCPTTEVTACAHKGRRVCDALCFALQHKKTRRQSSQITRQAQSTFVCQKDDGLK